MIAPNPRPTRPHIVKPPAIKVTRVTMPRYSVEFPDVATALDMAQGLRRNRIGLLAHRLDEHPGAEVVLDVSVRGLALTVSLLFRVVQPDPDKTVLEWWPRRQTDPALLNLWVETLEEHRKADTPQGIHPETLRAIFDLCRRAMSRNPFTALEVHWSSSPEEIHAAYEALITALKSYKAQPGVNDRARALLDQAIAQAPHAAYRLSTLEGRVKARQTFVPKAQLAHARELLESKLEIARVRGDHGAIYTLRRQLAELGNA